MPRIASKDLRGSLGTAKRGRNFIDLDGFGERKNPVVMRKIKIEIGDKIFNSRIAWSLIGGTPLLLRRL